MRRSRVITAGIIIAVIFLYGTNALHAGPSLWPNSKGEICLSNVDSGEKARLAVMRTVGNHYIIHGIATDSEGHQTLVNGNAILDGNKVKMHLTGSGHYVTSGSVIEVHGFIGSVVLDAGTLKGYIVILGFHCDDPGSPSGCDFSNDGVQSLQPATDCP
jgi:hypothetical protein